VYYILPPVIALYFTLLAILVMDYGLSNDGLAIVLTIIGVGLAVLFQLRNELKNQTSELRNQTNKFVETEGEMNKMNNFLMQTTLSQTDIKA
jgi:uncharacterized membrane protein